MKSPYPCAGSSASGGPCRTAADAIVEHEGVDVAVCQFHVELAADLGTIVAPHGYARKQKAKREALEGLELIQGADANVLDKIQARLAALGSATAAGVAAVIRDGLKAKRWASFDCVSCGKRNRVNVADMATRIATAKLASDIAKPDVTTPAGAAAWMQDGDFNIYDPETPTAALISAAFPDREAWILRHHRDGNLGTRISEAIDVHRRWADGKWVTDEELARARHDLIDAQQLEAMLAPTIGLSFSRRENVTTA